MTYPLGAVLEREGSDSLHLAAGAEQAGIEVESPFKPVLLHQERLHKMGVRVFAQTLPPRIGFVKKGYTPEMETLRVSINGWIRESTMFDYIFDADALLRDQNNPNTRTPILWSRSTMSVTADAYFSREMTASVFLE